MLFGIAILGDDMNMKRIIGTGALVLVAAIALAATTIVGAIGQGAAVNREGKRAEFNIDAWKARNGDVVRVGGFARFIAFFGTNERPETFGINCPEVRTLGKSGNICQFGGRASMQIRVGAVYNTVRGAVTFNVTDRRNPETNTGEPDIIRVRFVQAETNRVFEWAGTVHRGDIRVYERVVQ